MTATPPHYIKLGADSGGARPVAAVIRVGKKGPTGNPVDSTGKNAGYLIVRAEALGTGRDARRSLHSAFMAFNNREPEDRRTVRAILPDAELQRIWEMRRTAKEIKGYPRQPSYFVTCESRDGATAERLYHIGEKRAVGADGEVIIPPDDAERVGGKPDDEGWYRIPCPGDLCPYHQRRECTPNSYLYLILDEPDCPRALCRFWTGGGATTVPRIAAFFDDTERTVREGAGLQLTNWSGLPVALNLGQGANLKGGHIFAVSSLVLRDYYPLALKAQRQAIEGDAGGRLELPPAIIDGEVVEPETELAKAHDAVDAAPGIPQTVVGDDQPDLFDAEAK